MHRRRVAFSALALCALAFGASVEGCGCGSPPSFIVDGGGGDEPQLDALGDIADPFADAADSIGESACARAERTGDPLGCEYFVISPVMGAGFVSFACEAIFVSNPTDRPATLGVTFRGAALDPTAFGRKVAIQGNQFAFTALTSARLEPGESAVLALVQGYANQPIPHEHCPFPAAVKESVAVTFDRTADAFRIQSSEPVFVAQEIPFNDGDTAENISMTEVRATSNWDLKYREVGSYKPGRPAYFDGGVDGYPIALPTYPTHTIYTTREPTTLRIVRDAGVETYFLDAATAFNRPQDDLFIGTTIEANGKVGVGTGGVFMRVPWEFPGYPRGTGDYQDVAPTSSWGHVFPAVRHPPRYGHDDEVAVWRIIADADGTQLTYDPAPPPGAPTQLAAGEMGVFYAAGPFVVASQDAQHRLYVTQIMTTCDFDTCSDCTPCVGNEELVNVPPIDDYANRYVFVTDATIAETRLVVVRRRSLTGFEDVSLDCAGTLAGWKPVGGNPDYEWVYVSLSTGAFVPQVYSGGTCRNGPHAMDSKGLFAVTVWGWNNYVAYPENLQPASYAFVPFGLAPRPDRPPPK